jgi:hypothetical protein
LEIFKGIFFNVATGSALVRNGRKLRVLNLDEEIRVTEACIILSADSDGKEKRSALAGKNYEFARLFTMRKSGQEINIFVYVSLILSSVTILCREASQQL